MPQFGRFDTFDSHRNDLIEHVSQPLGVCNHRIRNLCGAQAIDPEHAFVGLFLDDFQLCDEFG
jgi:hypothetical protein